MPVRKFCKIVAVMILLFFWFPSLWFGLGTVLIASDVQKEMGRSITSMEESIEDIQNAFKMPGYTPPPVDLSPLRKAHPYSSGGYFVSSFLIYLVVLPLFSVWLFFPRNPLELLFLWLAEDRDEVSLTTILIRPETGDSGKIPQNEPEPPKPEMEKMEDNSKYRHPDEKYLPPQYRGK